MGMEFSGDSHVFNPVVQLVDIGYRGGRTEKRNGFVHGGVESQLSEIKDKNNPSVSLKHVSAMK